MRQSAALLVLAAGGVHLYLWFGYFHRVDVVGPLFLLNAATAASLAIALARSGRSAVLLAGLAYSAGTLVFFAISATAGLFGYHESLFGTWQVLAAAVEIGALATLALLLIRAG